MSGLDPRRSTTSEPPVGGSRAPHQGQQSCEVWVLVDERQRIDDAAGLHYCFGAPMARREVHLALAALASRLDNPGVPGDPGLPGTQGTDARGVRRPAASCPRTRRCWSAGSCWTRPRSPPTRGPGTSLDVSSPDKAAAADHWYRLRTTVENIFRDSKLGAALRHLRSGHPQVNRARPKHPGSGRPVFTRARAGTRLCGRASRRAGRARQR